MTQGYRTRRAIVVTDQGTYYGQGRMSAPLPAEQQAALLTDLPRLLAGAASILTGGEGVLMIAGKTVADMRPPAPLAESGWTFTELRPWTTFRSKQATVHVGLLAAIEPARSPLFHPNEDADAIASALDRFHVLTGSPWHGTGGVVGCGAIRAAHSRPGKGQQPLWSHTLPRGIRGVGPLLWHREIPADASGWVHVFDINAQYLAALRNAQLAWGPLEHTGDQISDTMQAAGFWLIDASGLPAVLTGPNSGRPPVVPARLIRPDTGAAWVSAPVMRYLCQIGYNPEVLDSWTTLVTGPIARSYAERLTAARTGMIGEATRPILDAIKTVYTETVGMMGREGGRIFRRDWQMTVMDLARMNLQRRLDRCADLTGQWPIRVNVDAAYYLTDDPSPDQLGAALGLGRGAGTFKHVRSVTVDEYRADLAAAVPARTAARALAASK